MEPQPSKTLCVTPYPYPPTPSLPPLSCARLLLLVSHFGIRLDAMQLLLPGRSDAPLAWEALVLAERATGEKTKPRWQAQAMEYSSTRDMRFDTLHVAGWRQEASDHIDQNDLWSDFLPSQVRKAVGTQPACGAD